MEQKASDIQKQRIKEIETKADELVRKCEIMSGFSANGKGCPRICCVRNKKGDKQMKILSGAVTDHCIVTSPGIGKLLDKAVSDIKLHAPPKAVLFHNIIEKRCLIQ